MFANVLIANRGEIACRIIRTARRLACARSRCTRRPTAARCSRGSPTRRTRSAAAPKAISTARRSSRSAKRVGAAMRASRLWLPLRERRIRRTVRERGPRLHRAAAGGDARDGPQERRQGADGRRPACRSCRAITATIRRRSSSRRRPTRSAIRCSIKAIAGGGGRGMRRVDAHADFDAALEGAAREAQAAFGDARVLIEKYVAAPAPYRGADLRRLARRSRPPVRARLLAAAPASEGDRGSPAPGLPEATRAAMARRRSRRRRRSATSAPARSNSSPILRAASARTASISSR